MPILKTIQHRLFPKGWQAVARKAGHNLLIDRQNHSVSFDRLKELPGVDVKKYAIDTPEYLDWLEQYYPNLKKNFDSPFHKKLVEFYTTFSLLQPVDSDAFMDAAGAISSYLPQLNCTKKYLQDIRISEAARQRLGDSVEYIEGDAKTIPLPDNSIDKISCHHSIEHFQGEADIDFIKEVQRLLRPGGRCCIVPIFIGEHFMEVTNTLSFKRKFSPESRYLIDPTAGIPGSSQSGNYARIYNLDQFTQRILQNIDRDHFQVSLSELILEGETVPHLHLECQKHVSKINKPYRALLIERKA